MAKYNSKVALISMPMLGGELPSFQLGLLKPTLEREGIDIQTFSLYLYFGTHIGFELNDSLSMVRPSMAGEWLWSKAAFGEFADDEGYLRIYRDSLLDICREANASLEDLLEIRHKKTFSFIDFCLTSVDWSRFQLIGFSVVFQQMTASLALARALKEKYPHIPIILGGATFEDDIAEGIMGGCPYVDFIHCGDADTTFPKMVARLDKGESMEGLSGLMWRDGEQIRYNGRAPNHTDMDRTPIPDFDEYFYARSQSGYANHPNVKQPMIPIETGRGCWWGEKNHCTFCGLNRAGMAFRSKSPGNVLTMLQTLTRRYGQFCFDAIDNIMATEYIDQLFGELSKSNSDLRLHYEVRPYLSREQLGRMKRGGLFSVQPGIESFSTHVLKLMKKHSKGIKNLTFLKWTTYYGINNLYNILYGFLGEMDEDYELQSQIIDKIPHFQPPYAIAKARPDRGSPMFTQPKEHGINSLTPTACYQYIYPDDRFDRRKVSYYFDPDATGLASPDAYRRVASRVTAWQRRWRQNPRPTLRYFKSPNTVHIVDNRFGEVKRYMYTDKAAELFELCADATPMKKLASHFEDNTIWVAQMLGEFIARDLVLDLDDQYLNLALPANPYM